MDHCTGLAMAPQTLLRKLPSLAAGKHILRKTNFAARKQENVFASGQEQFCFPDTDFASETYVS